MSDNAYIKKKQRERNRSFLTLRVLLGLIFMSGVVAAGFYFEFGRIPTTECINECENLYSLSTWLIGGFILFGGIIVAAAIVGGLIATIKWSRRNDHGTLSSLIPKDADKDP